MQYLGKFRLAYVIVCQCFHGWRIIVTTFVTRLFSYHWKAFRHWWGGGSTSLPAPCFPPPSWYRHWFDFNSEIAYYGFNFYVSLLSLCTFNSLFQFAHYCSRCNAKFARYFCGLCKHLTGTDDNPYHCEKCGICRWDTRVKLAT
jgi:hypothetical protein